MHSGKNINKLSCNERTDQRAAIIAIVIQGKRLLRFYSLNTVNDISQSMVTFGKAYNYKTRMI